MCVYMRARNIRGYYKSAEVRVVKDIRGVILIYISALPSVYYNLLNIDFYLSKEICDYANVRACVRACVHARVRACARACAI